MANFTLLPVVKLKISLQNAEYKDHNINVQLVNQILIA